MSELFLAKGVPANTAVEGNPLSEEQVPLPIERKIDLPQSKQYAGREVDNVVAVMADITIDTFLGDWDIDLEPICRFNASVLARLDASPEVAPGQIRIDEVGVGRSSGAPAHDCRFRLQRLCEWLNGSGFHPDNEMRVPLSLIRSVLEHLYLAKIHPFGDGNGRTARLMSHHYNATRTVYYRQLDRASAGGDPLPFLEYAIQGFVVGLRELLEPVWKHPWDLAGATRSTAPSAEMARQIARRATSYSTLPSALAMRAISPRVAVDDSDLSDKALWRDLRDLFDRAFLTVGKEGQTGPGFPAIVTADGALIA